MPDYQYSGRDSSGQQVSGQLVAANQGAAMSQLQSKKIVITGLIEAVAEKKSLELSFSIKKKNY